MNCIGLIPRHVHYELRQTRNDLVFITYKSALSWFIENTEVPRQPKKSEYLSLFDETMNLLKDLTPIFSRFYGSLHLLDLALRELTMQTIALSEALVSQSIRVVFMGTASSHHLETQILEIAARLAKIPQVFEYYLPDTVDVLPFLQTQGMSTRVVFPYRYEYQFESNFLHALKSDWKAPRDVSLYKSPWYRYSYNYGISQLYVSLGYPLRKIGANGNYERRNDYFLKHIQLNEELQLLKFQNESLKTLIRFQAQDADSIRRLFSVTSNDNPILCIYAHFQPEATTFPEGGQITNHIDLVAKVRSLGYKEPILYLEHPSTKGFSQGIKNNRVGIARSTSYYETLRTLGCLFLDQRKFKNLPLFVIPITMTGSIGLERSLVGKHTIVTGVPWYFGTPGTISLEEGLAHIINLTTSFDSKVAHDFLRDLVEYRAYPSTPLIESPNKFPEIEKWKKMYHFLLDQSLQIKN